MSKYSDGKDYKVVALCTAKFYGSEEIDFIRAFYSTCYKKSCRIVMFSTYSDFYNPNPSDKCETQIFSLMDVALFDAVVISSETFKTDGIAQSIADRAIEANVPVFSLIKRIDGCITISFGYGNAFEQIVRHVVEDHHLTKFVFLAGMKGNAFSEARISCFKKVLEENGIPFNDDDLYYGDFWETPTAKVMDRFFESGKPMPEAFVCANDYMAMEVCRKLNDHGYEIPKDVIVTGFDGAYLERFHYPRLTTAEQDLEGLADVLYDVIDRSLNDIPVEKEYIIDFRFRKSQSCGCVKNIATDEEMQRMGLEYSKTNKHLREFVSIFETLFETTTRYAHSDELKPVFSKLLKHLYDVKVNNFALMLNSDFLGEDHELNPNTKVFDERNARQYYSPEMIVALDYYNGELCEIPKIHLSDLMPRLSDILDNNVCLLFTPLYVMNNTIGYTATTFKAVNFEFAMYYAFLMNLRQILETHKMRQDLENLYSLDQLTKLYNRKGFYKHVLSMFETAVLNQKEYGFISFDMNWLKQINDTYGHAEGDYALYTIASVMRRITREGEVCARFGGDEFAIAFSCENAGARAAEIVSGVKDELARINTSHGKKYRLSVSAGFHAGIPAEERDFERYIMSADKVMYSDKKEIKENGKWDEVTP